MQKPSSMNSVAFRLHSSTMATWEWLQRASFRTTSVNPWGDSSIVEDHTLTEPNPVTANDAGLLLRNLIILWIQGITLGSIKDQNVSHFIRLTRRSQEIIVTFDGYLGLQRKAMYNDERQSKFHQDPRLCSERWNSTWSSTKGVSNEPNK